ncbi:LacI family DNA-binding transcriptional regulator [Cerasicoccus arenae]|nr:LacI family DNA-binding transcriptional regulator [Cerasicoccus arenae]MBK1858107.1 LacI family DNA-binding transcriptional regulator [Cerasicoccus arenae]
MQTIADRIGVSKNAVSLALKHDPSISEETRNKILAVANELGYRRNQVFGEVMSQMRKRGSDSVSATIALINGNQNHRAFREHPTIPNYVTGCKERASQLGYAIDSLWLFDQSMSGQRWIDILQTRGIRGIVVVGLMNENQLPPAFVPVIEAFPCVVTGVRTREPTLSFSCVDHHILALRAFEKALELGYQRPGLVLDSVIDQLVEHRFSAGYQSGQTVLPKSRRIQPFFDVAKARENHRHFQDWLKKEQPDVIFTLYNEVHAWLEDMGLKVPKDIGLIQLEWRASRPNWAGMNQHNDIVGQTAMDMLIGMIHRGDKGAPPFPRATLIGPTWVNGQTVRQQTHGHLTVKSQ